MAASQQLLLIGQPGACKWLVSFMVFLEKVREIDDVVCCEFLYDISPYDQRFEDYQSIDNQAVQEKLDELLENDAILAKDFQANRT